MFETKTSSSSPAKSDPVNNIRSQINVLDQKKSFNDPYYTEWDNDIDYEPPFKNKSSSSSPSRRDQIPDPYFMTPAGMLANIYLEEMTLPGSLKSEEEGEIEKVPETSSHEVIPGDTLASLALKYGVSEELIKEANPGKVKKYKLKSGKGYIESFNVGEELSIPAQKLVAEPKPEVANESDVSNDVKPAESVTESKPDPVAEPIIKKEPAKEKNLPAESKVAAENKILEELVTTGAGKHTAASDKLEAGVEASEAMAKRDLDHMKDYLDIFKKVAEKYGLPTALLVAIASRESRGGTGLNENGYGKSDGDGFGLMQVDKQNSPEGTAYSETNIEQAAEILMAQYKVVKKKHPDWTVAEQLRGAVAAYNFGAKNVQTKKGVDKGTTGDDYSSDIWARARYYSGLEEFGGKGALAGEATKAGEKETDSITAVDDSIICFGVGKPSPSKKKPANQKKNMNYAADVILVQDRLLELGLLSEADHSAERQAMITPGRAAAIKPDVFLNTEPLEEEKEAIHYRKQMAPENLVATIKAIEVFQQQVIKSSVVDGRLDAKGGTIKSLMDPSFTAELVKEKRGKYAVEKALAEKKAKEEAAERARIEAIRNEPATDENADRITAAPRSSKGVAMYLNEYLVYNPRLILKVLERLDVKSGAKVEVIMYLLSFSSDTTLMRCDVEVLQTLRNTLTQRFIRERLDLYGTKEEQHQIPRLDRLIEKTKNLNLKDLAIEAADNEKDERKYRWNWKDKNAGTGVDCSHFIKEVVATAESKEARLLKQDKGYLTPEEINLYSKSFTDENLKEFQDEERGTRRMARYLEKYGYYSTSLEDVKEGDIVFIGKGEEKSIGTIGHIVIIIEIKESPEGKKYVFADSGMSGASYNKTGKSYEGGNRSVRKDQTMNSDGVVWKGSPVERCFKGVGKLNDNT